MSDEDVITPSDSVQDTAPVVEVPVVEPASEVQPAVEPEPQPAPEVVTVPVAEPPAPVEPPAESEPVSVEEKSETPPPAIPPHETVIERVREPSEEEKALMFRARLKSLSPQGVSARRAKREANYEKILAHLKAHGYISNNDVETLCQIKDAAATAYLRELVRRGMVTKIGRGRASRYRLTQAIG